MASHATRDEENSEISSLDRRFGFRDKALHMHMARKSAQSFGHHVFDLPDL